MTYIDYYTAAFEPVSHKFLDVTLTNTKTSRKSRVIFRAIYAVAAGMARVNNIDVENVYLQTFTIYAFSHVTKLCRLTTKVGPFEAEPEAKALNTGTS